jgi:Thioredoxin like C-terminal domain
LSALSSSPPERVQKSRGQGRIVYRFHARHLHLMMGPPARGTPVRFLVLLDGQGPGAAHGTDVDDQGNGTVTDPRLYQLVRQPGSVSERTFEVTFLDPGIQATVAPPGDEGDESGGGDVTRRFLPGCWCHAYPPGSACY